MLTKTRSPEGRGVRPDPVMEHVLAVLANCAEDEPHGIHPDTELNDLRHFGIDSLVLVGAMLEVGETYGIAVDELIECEIDTVGELVNMVKRRQSEMLVDARRTTPLTAARIYQAPHTLGLAAEPSSLQVLRTGIVFRNLDPQRVRVEITLSNTSAHRTAPTPIRLQAAPLGAFLPWQDLTTVWVQSLEAGASVTVGTEVRSPRPRALGSYDQIPPRRLLTALGFDDKERRRPQSMDDIRQFGIDANRPWLDQRARGNSSTPELPPDPADLLGRPNLHWAGNINVLVGREAVERHVAQALRIYPGRRNVAMMIVGDGRRDAYRFELRGLGANWTAFLSRSYDLSKSPGECPEYEIELGTWHQVSGPLCAMLNIQPPEDCVAGELEVHVTRKSSGESAIVEFSLDPQAQGPGCFVA